MCHNEMIILHFSESINAYLYVIVSAAVWYIFIGSYENVQNRQTS